MSATQYSCDACLAEFDIESNEVIRPGFCPFCGETLVWDEDEAETVPEED